MSEQDKTTRRGFLGAAAAAPLAATVAAPQTAEAKAAPTPQDDTRIQDTAHTRAYLESTRF